MSPQKQRSLAARNLTAPMPNLARDLAERVYSCKRSYLRLLFMLGLVLFPGILLAPALAQSDESPAIDISDQPHNIKTVFLILMENHNWTGGSRLNSIKESELAPYINDVLLPMASHANNYFNPPKLHPSLPNYLWLEAGTNFGILDDANPFAHHQNTHRHLVALLEHKGISWRAYDERATGKACPFTRWHTPFVFFDDETDNNNPQSDKCIAHHRPFSELQRDLDADTVARYNFIAPNLCDSMHSVCAHENGESAITEGDKWLADIVPAILRSAAYRNNGVIFILWDEGRGKSDGPVPLIVLSPLAKGNGYSNNIHYTHGSTLRTLEEIFGVTPLLGDAARQRDLRDLFLQFP